MLAMKYFQSVLELFLREILLHTEHRKLLFFK